MDTKMNIAIATENSFATLWPTYFTAATSLSPSRDTHTRPVMLFPCNQLIKLSSSSRKWHHDVLNYPATAVATARWSLCCDETSFPDAEAPDVQDTM
jgi:hypothetical protein